MRRVPAALLALLFSGLLAALAAVPAVAQDDDARYALANGCYALRSEATGGLVAKAAGGAYAATAADAAGAEGFRMKATDLGRYLLYGKAGDFLATQGDDVRTAADASDRADWRVDAAGGETFRLVLPAAGGKALVAGDGGTLALGDAAGAGDGARFRFVPAEGCATYPEVDVSATGTPSKGPVPYSETQGFIDAHMHMMAFEFLGGSVHCGRPWHPYGAPHALVDCPDHQPNGAGAVLENQLSAKRPVGTHDPVGWPTFVDWPAPHSLTHEQSYYRWVERAYLGGLRIFVNLLVDNAVLCEVYPLKRNSCNEMDGVRLQARRIRELERYIDAQHGGPGKGWFRIVRDPFEARRVVNDGKLAVVLGIEVSKLFDCGEFMDQPECTKRQIDQRLQEVHDLGVRDLELVNKFDNALGGVAGDAGDTGVVTNTGNKYETGQFWSLETCRTEGHDRTQHAPPHTHNTDQLIGNGMSLLPPGTAPVYPPPPHCNAQGLSELGVHLVERMIEKGMIIDPDHLSVRARNQLLDILEARNYPGIVSSHSWSTPDAFPRIYRLGGVITPYAGDSTGFVEKWKATKPMHPGTSYFGFGYGADMNGFGAQGDPRHPTDNPVTYPFKSFDGAVTLDKQRSGERVYDINTDGVAHYGLYPDWIEDLRKLAGDGIVADMARGAEAYLQMWERAEGVAPQSCLPARARLGRRGVARLRLHDRAERSLRRSGQPARRTGRVWRHCTADDPRRQVSVVFTSRERVGLVASAAPGWTARGIGPGARTSRLRGRTRPFGAGIRVRPSGGGGRYVYGVRRGRVRWVAVAARSVVRSRSALRSHLRLAGLR